MKFEPKVMLWIVMSPKGISTQPIRQGAAYVDNCLEHHLIPFLNTYYRHGGYVCWPDKASAHYARFSTSFLDRNNVNYVKKEDNPTEVPQCRPVEDFFGLPATRVYHRNWVAKDVAALKRRIRKGISEIPPACTGHYGVCSEEAATSLAGGILEVCH